MVRVTLANDTGGKLHHGPWRSWLGTRPPRRARPPPGGTTHRAARPAGRVAFERTSIAVRTFHPAGLAPRPRRHRPRAALGCHGRSGPPGRRQPGLVLDLGLRPHAHHAAAE